MTKSMTHKDTTKKEVKSAYASVNGLKMYYEIHGSGEPLLLLHGGIGAIEMFNPILPALSASQQVIGVDMQAHGRTADLDRPLSYELMADDIAGLIRYLGQARADIMGYSLGGGVALQTAIRHSDVVRKLVVVSAPFKREGWYPEIRAAMAQGGTETAEAMKPTLMYQLYASLAPSPEDWPVLHMKLGVMLKQPYDWSKDVAAVKVPVLIVVGDADAVRPEHAVEFFGLLGGGKRDAGWDGSGRPLVQLAILPGTTHYNICQSPMLASIVTRFLNIPLSSE